MPKLSPTAEGQEQPDLPEVWPCSLKNYKCYMHTALGTTYVSCVALVSSHGFKNNDCYMIKCVAPISGSGGDGTQVGCIGHVWIMKSPSNDISLSFLLSSTVPNWTV